MKVLSPIELTRRCSARPRVADSCAIWAIVQSHFVSGTCLFKRASLWRKRILVISWLVRPFFSVHVITNASVATFDCFIAALTSFFVAWAGFVVAGATLVVACASADTTISSITHDPKEMLSTMFRMPLYLRAVLKTP